MFDIADNADLSKGARIKVIGVGGGGCNAVNSMIRSGLVGVEYIVANTDVQALAANLAGTKIQIGGNITKGLGAGANPEIGRKAAIEDYEKLSEVLDGADMVFVTAGMGGGTGTGAAPVIAKLAREMGALTVGVVTKPFTAEGKRRIRVAEEGIKALEESVDSLICVPNQRLVQLAGESLALIDSLKVADEVLLNAVQGISDLINNTGLINADFADVSTVMTNKGLSLMGTGLASGPDRAVKAARMAISSPLLEDISINGATGVIINVTASASLTTFEANQAVTLIMEAADEEAEIIFGTVIDESLGDNIKITVIATGLENARMAKAATPSAPVMQERPAPVAQPVMQATRVAPVPESAPMYQTTAAPNPTPAMQMNAAPVRMEPRHELPSEAPAITSQKKTDYAVKSESSFNLDAEKVDNRPKINWAEKLQTAASKYESQKNPEVMARAAAPIERPSEYNHVDSTPALEKTETVAQAVQTRESRIKSIAEKLGFFNFDEDEFDTPSFMRKNERNHDSQI